MKTIWYESIEDVLLSITDPNTWWAISSVPWVSAPKINWATSVYNVEAGWWEWIAWWSTDAKWTAWVWSISWSSWNINLPDWTQVAISSGSTTVSAPTYIYVDTTTWTVSSTTHSYEAVGENKIMICAAFPNSWKNVTFKAFGCADQNSLTKWSDIANGTIVANNIASWTITADQIASWTITANEIASNTITASEIASWAITTAKISSWAVTAGKIDVSELSAIVAKLGDVYVWDKDSWSAIRIYPYSSSIGRIDFYYNWSVIGYIRWQSVSWLWGVVYINWNYIYFSWTTYCGSKLRIPVWTDLYN